MYIVHRASYILLMLGVLMSACRSDSNDTDEQPTMLQIYVYAPDHMLPTRANTDYVKAQDGESTINTLQIWVFEHDSGNLVGYFTPPTTTDLNSAGSAVYQMAVTPQFVTNRPEVDVYVLANVSMTELGDDATRVQLEAAVMKHTTGESGQDPFGLTTLVTAVPDTGLPMSGVLKNQKVTGDSPTLRIGDEDLATVKLVRAVSKVRFLFSQMENGEGEMKVKSVKLTGEEILPKEEFLFLEDEYTTGREYNINNAGGYDAGPVQMVEAIDNVASTTDPLKYTYSPGMGAQVYETLIASGLTAQELTLGGLFYLRESDKKLTGEIQYTVNDGDVRTATFSMHDAGDFSRNHTWVVYAFYGSTTLDILVVKIKDWEKVQDVDHTVYNW